MCGIVGIIDLAGREQVDGKLVEAMNQSQFHRGPDQGGVHLEPGVGLGHRRLSIIDLSSGRQPLFNEDGSVVVVYNGEIYNFASLADELRRRGHRFRTHCDTEVIVHAWEEWGERCVHRFRGMFAFALWDRNNRRVFLARDRLGIKPLYYSLVGNRYLVFSSELKALLLHPGLNRTVDRKAVEDYFTFGYVPEPRTILCDVHKLAPGHYMEIEHGRPEVRQSQYWDVPFQPLEGGDENELAEELRDRLREAVRIRLLAEVPLGAFLSGGVDSSAVVAMMAGLNPEEPVNTCAIGFRDPAFNESDYAAMVARRYGTNHSLEIVESDDFDLLDRLADLYDEPFADSSAIPTYRVCELARKRVTVALSGDGGDENFAGYRRHRWHMLEERVRARLPFWFRRSVFGLLGEVYPKLDWAPRIFRAKTTFQALARDTIGAYLHTVSIVDASLRRQLFSSAFTRDLQGYESMEVFRRHAAAAPTDDALSLIQYLDMKTYLPGDILTKVDRASMAHALEVRVPLLDHELVEWVSGIPSSLKLRGTDSKYILKRALEDLLPHEILYRSKMGFAVPLAGWFRGPLRERVQAALLGESMLDSGIFNERTLRHVVQQHQSGARDYSAAIWALLMFESFQRRLEGGARQPG